MKIELFFSIKIFVIVKVHFLSKIFFRVIWVLDTELLKRVWGPKVMSMCHLKLGCKMPFLSKSQLYFSTKMQRLGQFSPEEKKAIFLAHGENIKSESEANQKRFTVNRSAWTFALETGKTNYAFSKEEKFLRKKIIRLLVISGLELVFITK